MRQQTDGIGFGRQVGEWTDSWSCSYVGGRLESPPGAEVGAQSFRIWEGQIQPPWSIHLGGKTDIFENGPSPDW